MGLTIPTTEPPALVAGDTWKWKKTYADFPVSENWTLTYELRGQQVIALTASADNGSYLINQAASDTAHYAPGDYTWAAYVSKAGERYQVGSGQFKICPNLAKVKGSHDGRSHAKRMLDALEAVMQGRAKEVEQSYGIAGRWITKLSPKDLRDEWGFWKAQYRQEQIAAGQLKPTTIGVKFV